MTNNRTRMASRAPGKPHQKGVVLIVVLMMLIGITLISMAAVNTSVMELRMARNAEYSVNNFQTALSAIDFVISDPANLPTLGPLMQTTPVPLTGTVFAVGTGLKLELGISTSHPEYPTVLPPVGWIFRNLSIYLEPGGPYGAAPPCP